MMQVLLVVPYVPSLIRTRSLNLIRHLALRGHSISLFTLWADREERQDLERLTAWGVEAHAFPQPRSRSFLNCLMALPTRSPLQSVYCWNPDLARTSADLLTPDRKPGIDLVHVEHLRGARYGLHLKAITPNVPMVWDSVDCISYLFQQASGQSRSLLARLLTRMDLNRTRGHEGFLATQFDRILITSRADQEALQNLVPSTSEPTPISILPNGVDWEYFSEDLKVPRDPATIILSGKMSYHANVTMALYLVQEIMPWVWDKRHEVMVEIVGKDPPASLRALAQDTRVKVTGTVQDVRPHLQRATLSVVPLLYGAGSQFKVLEAMASGTPVVATPQAVQAFDSKPGRDCLIAEGPKGLAEQILRLLDDPGLRSSVGASGRRYVAENHPWAKSADRLEAIYREVLSRKT